ncbi:hypothetical protein LS482_10630 [Sinomicrobium kalidii]|uniref:hypothetical protein n=1 Tax=Sinomicrobium kalidii TaxID=2900738 RepID=UPI001E4E2285|nr:hypothetical protein [Sinomicrobium kalidii]UGU18320.1 hypothetical protein LS482_10630 [Sinomicrobium kalidii]
MKKLAFGLSFLTLLITVSCSDDDGPTEPGMATLIFPENNSECTTGDDIDDYTSRVTFEWEPSDRTDTYRLQVENLNDGTAQEFNTEATSLGVVLQKGEPYSWTVTSTNQDVPETSQSETWKFYNAGDGTESYAPFPATAVSPEPDETVAAGEGTLTLEWKGNDIDGDIVGYDVYFGNANPPETVEASDLEDTVLDVNVSPKTVYYWKVVTRDSQGNESNSGVFVFKVN